MIVSAVYVKIGQLINYPPVYVDIRHRIDQVFLPIGGAIISVKLTGKVAQDWDVLLLY